MSTSGLCHRGEWISQEKGPDTEDQFNLNFIYFPARNIKETSSEETLFLMVVKRSQANGVKERKQAETCR